MTIFYNTISARRWQMRFLTCNTHDPTQLRWNYMGAYPRTSLITSLFRMEHFAEDSEFLLARKKLNLNLANSWRHKHGGQGGLTVNTTIAIGKGTYYILILRRLFVQLYLVIFLSLFYQLLSKLDCICAEGALKANTMGFLCLPEHLLWKKDLANPKYSGVRSKFELERSYYSKLTVSEVEGLVQIYRYIFDFQPHLDF